uniref:UDP-N-acetylglucosamine--peptide N-acetylglucosaminyltransferase SPINDLY n=1 Tax=Heterosigma akashiwo TaxID=2829 RepID=A0A7S3UNH3_HETAK
MTVETAMKGNRPGTSRPVTSLGRELRLGTASMATDIGGPFINVDRLDLAKYAKRPTLSMVLCEYLVYHDRNARKGLELAAEATVHHEYKDWWWKARLGKCYYKLGLYRDAERQLKSSLKDQDMVVTVLELVKVYVKLDLPNTALDLMTEAAARHPGESRLLLGIARIHDMLSDHEAAVGYYKKVLQLDSSNVEAISSLAANHFYSDQPEIALRYYRRLLQMGVNNTELWNNLGLSCFYASQYDMALGCFERALALAADETAADVWYNVGQVAVGIGDLGLAYQAFKIGVAADGGHAECFCNLGVLELRKQNIEAARAAFKTAQGLAPFAYEPFYNGALIAYKLGEFQEAHATCARALEIYPDHTDSQELLQILKNHFAVL